VMFNEVIPLYLIFTFLLCWYFLFLATLYQVHPEMLSWDVAPYKELMIRRLELNVHFSVPVML